ncbi:hypothetical protein WJX82_006376 [Trebouxia sp. C0006]
MTRGRRANDDSSVLAMFQLIYRGTDATPLLTSDASMTAEEKWEHKFDLHWRLLAPASRTTFLVGLRKWQVVKLPQHIAKAIRMIHHLQHRP